MRVVTWNMGMGSRLGHKPGEHDQAWHFLLGLGPDLAFVQEALPPSWVRTEGTLVCGPFKQWGSAIFSPRYPLERLAPPEHGNLHLLGSYLAYATVSLPDGSEVFAASVHARPKGAPEALLKGIDTQPQNRGGGGPKVNDVIFAGLVDLVGDRFILGGDWNTARNQGGKPSRGGGAFFDLAESERWYDCSFKKLQVEVQTWFGRGKLLQDDYVFCDEQRSKQLRGVSVATTAATDFKLSDHAPLILDFDVPNVAQSLWEQESQSSVVSQE